MSKPLYTGFPLNMENSMKNIKQCALVLGLSAMASLAYAAEVSRADAAVSVGSSRDVESRSTESYFKNGAGEQASGNRDNLPSHANTQNSANATTNDMLQRSCDPTTDPSCNLANNQPNEQTATQESNSSHYNSDDHLLQ